MGFLIQPLNMLRFCFVLTMATLAAAGPGYKSMMMKKMAKHYFDQMCWGKDNQMAKYKSIKESLATEDGDETSPFLPCPHLFHCVAISVHQVPPSWKARNSRGGNSRVPQRLGRLPGRPGAQDRKPDLCL